jgi:hypothetical protein
MLVNRRLRLPDGHAGTPPFLPEDNGSINRKIQKKPRQRTGGVQVQSKSSEEHFTEDQ